VKREYLNLTFGETDIRMRKRRRRRRIFLMMLLFLFGGTVGLGTWRYGGVAGLTRRVQLEARQYLPEPPRPTAAPTLSTAVTVDVRAFVAAIAPETATPAVTPTLWPTDTAEPDMTPVLPTETATPFPSPTSEPTATPIYQVAAESVYIDRFTHNWQGWNNCGPATLTTYLSALGTHVTQDDVAAVLKPNVDDKNVDPAEIAAHARSYGYEVRVLVNGTPERLKLLLSNGYPVMLETWLEPEPNDGFGHYRLVVGYDDAVQEWIVSDSYVSENVKMPYEGIRISYEEMNGVWSVFAQTHIVVYPPADAPLIDAIIGEDIDPDRMWLNALTTYQLAVQADAEDPFVWHNLGTALVELGEMEQAAVAFDQARTLGLPWRMFWYQFGAYEAYHAIGRYDDVVGLANATNDTGGGGEEVYYWKGMGLAALGDNDGASQAWRYALWWYPEYEPAVQKLVELEG